MSAEALSIADMPADCPNCGSSRKWGRNGFKADGTFRWHARCAPCHRLLSRQQRALMISLYTSGTRSPALADHFGVHEAYVRKAVARAGLRSPHKPGRPLKALGK